MKNRRAHILPLLLLLGPDGEDDGPPSPGNAPPVEAEDDHLLVSDGELGELVVAGAVIPTSRSDLPEACRSCGDPRGPGACGLE